MAFSEIELNDLKYMVENGFKLKEICEVLGKSMDTIRTEIKLMQLKSPRKFREKNGKIFCLNCREYKDKNEFYKSKQHSYGFYVNCKKCSNKIDSERYHSKKEEQFKNKYNIKVKTKEEVNGSNFRKCTQCNEIKDVSDFNWNKKYKELYDRIKKDL